MTTRAGKIAWTVLLILAAGWTLNHLAGIFLYAGDTPRLVFVSFAAVDLAATLVLLFPYRRHRQWAWLAIWAEVATIASVFFWADREIGAWYGAIAVLMATAQLLTLREFSTSAPRRPVRNP
ncbi:hypothetical protein [Kribbella sp. CA-294648]|uniref:hypothetical protein n=1 Tax=Kribbella sp. CA-294648 TaxID=3239948 RepID=UPI003D8F1705